MKRCAVAPRGAEACWELADPAMTAIPHGFLQGKTNVTGTLRVGAHVQSIGARALFAHQAHRPRPVREMPSRSLRSAQCLPSPSNLHVLATRTRARGSGGTPQLECVPAFKTELDRAPRRGCPACPRCSLYRIHFFIRSNDPLNASVWSMVSSASQVHTPMPSHP